MQITETLERARALHRNGRINEARDAYIRVLKAEPENADALHLLGVTALQGGRHAEAVRRCGWGLVSITGHGLG